MNLLRETREVLADWKRDPEDIIFIGSETSGHHCTWTEFEVLADIVDGLAHGVQVGGLLGGVLDLPAQLGDAAGGLGQPLRRGLDITSNAASNQTLSCSARSQAHTPSCQGLAPAPMSRQALRTD